MIEHLYNEYVNAKNTNNYEAKGRLFHELKNRLGDKIFKLSNGKYLTVLDIGVKLFEMYEQPMIIIKEHILPMKPRFKIDLHKGWHIRGVINKWEDLYLIVEENLSTSIETISFVLLNDGNKVPIASTYIGTAVANGIIMHLYKEQ